ncbi:hypothetical protein [Sphingomonas bacterium]|uniref:hypothetical protein n=1 Tax=Sphingomonas bacterium TaxID=1895847 RepID=UPI001575075A|nr:hypothetical protein [Sphingomonas bacterium]
MSEVGKRVDGDGGQAGEQDAIQGRDAPDADTGPGGTEREASAWEAPTYAPHAVSAGGRTFDVVETSGVAQAEMLGKVGADATRRQEQESPDSG